MNKKLLFECSIDILGNNVGVKIYKDEDKDNFSFELSKYFQDESQSNVYKPGSGAFSDSLEGLLFKINLYKNQVHKIINVEQNHSF